ncbi:glycoside hydrolase family 88/105 protein [Caulobacter henricii]|uniref:Glucuronyl hydrolase n=1 Tax=Caulobacter henricii TaxID=69395 RepID=A0A0P0NZI2_9CAUL|nr:glycoside hydrolase family 88 protein [Caulobacter henricii]ALL13248.1 glucuronyl hydrolase [Caulobacter henricii]
MRASLILTLALMAMTTACSSVKVPGPPSRATVAPAAPREADVLALGRKVADWQLARLDSFDYIRTFKHNTVDPRGWIQGALYTGLFTFADRTGDPKYAEALLAHGVEQDWQLGRRPLHADDHAISQSWLWAYGKTPDPVRIAALRTRFDAILADQPTGDLAFQDGVGEPPCQTRWCWSDALYMAPPAWFGLSRVTGDPRYAAYADREFWATTDYLLDKDQSLYFRDSRYFTRRDDQGRKIFWSRGNGWSYAGIVNVLKLLPANHPSRPRYVALFRAMSDRLVDLQKADGYWAPSLLAPEGSPPETSGTAFFTYGLAWGVNTGHLTGPRYRIAADRGWSALARAVTPDGKLTWVQQVGYAPEQVEPDDTQLYGVGAFLLAASEVARKPH